MLHNSMSLCFAAVACLASTVAYASPSPDSGGHAHLTFVRGGGGGHTGAGGVGGGFHEGGGFRGGGGLHTGGGFHHGRTSAGVSVWDYDSAWPGCVYSSRRHHWICPGY